MATVYVSFGKAGQRGESGDLAVFCGPCRTETITSSGTAASGALTAHGDQIAQLYCETPVYARQDGTASTTEGVYVAGGIPVWIGLSHGQSISVIDV